jgi:hypothetical protein
VWTRSGTLPRPLPQLLIGLALTQPPDANRRRRRRRVAARAWPAARQLLRCPGQAAHLYDLRSQRHILYRASSASAAGDAMVRLMLLHLSREVRWETPRGNYGSLASQLAQARPRDWP